MDPRPAQILVVDDDPAVRSLIERGLTREGHSCRTAAGVDEALARVAAEQVDLVVSDIQMPGRSGLELLAELRVHHPDVAVLMVTAVDDRSTAIRALELGAFGYVVKPFDLIELAINVANALERRRLGLISRAHQSRLEEEVRERTADIRAREAEIALRLVAAAEFRDSDTGAHIRRIGLYSAAVAEALGWPRDKVDDLRVAAMMHDIGKIGVPDSILLKPDRLSAEELAVMRQHTLIGGRILDGSTIPLLAMAREIALDHHERWDGKGYPHATAGSSIPAHARVVAVVDAYDAMIHDRVYRQARPEALVLEEIQAEKGSQFDPEMVEAFMERLDALRRIRRETEG